VDLEEAVRALKAAEAGVPRAEERAEERARQIKAAARARVDGARQELHKAIVAEYGRGVRQVDIVKRTGYTRERVRQILRADGVEPE
jgi:BMFP domain-containing protein YqiC